MQEALRTAALRMLVQPKTLETLDGQVALVTGANRGIGHAIARQLSERGATVFAGHRDHPGDVPEGTHEVRLDVTDAAGVDAAMARIRQEAGRLDVLVNNAGTLVPGRNELEGETPEDIRRVLETNLYGTMIVTRAALPLLLEREGGRVVNVSSGMGAIEDMGGTSPSYRVSKTGINGFTVYLDAAYGGKGLMANAACPGWVHTDMGGKQAPRTPEEGARTPAWLAALAPGGPGGRFWRDRSVIPW